ncbi:MAG: ketoacyl-ACP synthase III [Desulfovibrionaceae bacterium]|jgi:3-oxoacyl-[acyl-carrier-protein] synthase-3|nr:ketoacyl-ACP synthase III [Desulfovibrionaceae bacterium]
MTVKTAIRGMGACVPPRVLTNADLEKMVDTSDEWITTRTGIKERHVVEPGEPVSDLAAAAARAALTDAGMAPEELTHILVATITPDAYCPSAACIVEEKLGLRGLPAFDISAACSGFLYALQMGRAILCMEPEAKVLVVAAEVLSSRTNWSDRATCVLFGDGAGAVVLTTEAERALATVEEVQLASDGSLGDLLTIRGGGSARPYALGEPVADDFFIQMGGREVFRHAVRNMEAISRSTLAAAGLATTDVDLFIPHQANLRIIDAVGKKLDFGADTVYVSIHKYGNTSGSSIPLAMVDARADGRIAPGTNVLLTAFGGGFTWGSALLKFK